MGPSNSIYLSNTAIFHFHEYGRKGIKLGIPEQIGSYSKQAKFKVIDDVLSGWVGFGVGKTGWLWYC